MNQGLKQLSDDEGRVAYAYKDHLGYLTIGDGILIDQRRGGGLLPEEMDFILANRVSKATSCLRAALPWFNSLNEPRQWALVNMCHQLGFEGLMAFKKMLAAMRDEHFEMAKTEALDSKWAKQDTPERAKRIAEQIATGEWQSGY